jgi:hypothetical protein
MLRLPRRVTSAGDSDERHNETFREIDTALGRATNEFWRRER